MSLEKWIGNVDLTKLSQSRRRATIVIPLNPKRDSLRESGGFVHAFQVAGIEEDRKKIYGRFVEELKPVLAEEIHHEGFGLRKLVVPTLQGMADGRYSPEFKVDEQNYFFRRAATHSEHKFWQQRFEKEKTDGNWLQPDLGKNFVLQVRGHLRTFCKFAARNYELINGFVEFAARFGSSGGLGPLTSDTGLPPKLAERILDHLYLGRSEAKIDLDNVELAHADVQGFQLASGVTDALKQTLTRLVEEYRRALLDRGSYDASTVKGKLPYEEARLVVKPLAAEFRQARSALHSLQEMIPCHVLPQESLAWLLGELFECVCGTRTPTTAEDFNKIAAAVTHGDLNRNIAPPATLGLKIEQRRQQKRHVLDHIEVVFDAVLGVKTLEELDLEEDVHAAVEASLRDEKLVSTIREMVPASAKESTRRSLREGSIKVFRSLFLSHVAPRMFGLPTFDLSELKELVDGYEVACILIANALASGDEADQLRERLKQDGTKVARVINDLVEKAGGTFAPADFAKTTGSSLSFMGTIASIIGDQLGRNVQLWRAVQEALSHSESVTSDTLLSSMRFLRRRPGKKQTSLDRSTVAVGEDMLKGLVRRTIGSNAEIARHLAEIQSSKREEKRLSAGIAEAETHLAVAVEAKNKADAGFRAAQEEAREGALAEVKLKEAAVRGTEAKKKNLEIEQEQYKLRTEDLRKKLSQLGKSKSDREIEELVDERTQLQAAVDKDGNKRDDLRELDKRIADLTEREPARRVTAILRRLNLTQSLSSDGPEDTRVNEQLVMVADSDAEVARHTQQVIDEFFQTPGSKEKVANLLREFEQLNHAVYQQYEKALPNTGLIEFRRQVEAMTLGKIMMSMSDRIGLGGQSSGLVKTLIHLIEKTGKEGDTQISGLELLSEVSLHEYVDSGLLQTGASVLDLHNQLQECARQSFENIKDFVSELHGIYYTMLAVPDGTTIEVANATAEEFRLWMDHENLSPEGKHPYSVLTSAERNANAAHIRTPGLLYLTGPSLLDDPVSELEKWASMPLARNDLAYVIPPLLLSAPTVPRAGGDWRGPVRAWDVSLRDGARFPWIIVGPGNVLNSREDLEFPTNLPAGYLLLGAFCGAPVPAVTPDQLGPSSSEGRLRKASGHGGGLEQDLRAALFGAVACRDSHGVTRRQAFAADYYLWNLLRLWGDLKPTQEDLNAAQFLGAFAMNELNPGAWSQLRDIRGFGDVFLGGDPCAYRLESASAGPGRDSVLEEMVAGKKAGQITDTAWWTRAYAELWNGR